LDASRHAALRRLAKEQSSRRSKAAGSRKVASSSIRWIKVFVCSIMSLRFGSIFEKAIFKKDRENEPSGQEFQNCSRSRLLSFRLVRRGRAD
jgi:hypothetical protein